MNKLIKKIYCHFKGHQPSGMWNLTTGKMWCINCGEELDNEHS